MLGAVQGNSNINAIRFFNATNAFKSQPAKQEVAQKQTEEGTNIRENSILRNINVDEIKKYADSVGETNLPRLKYPVGISFSCTKSISTNP